MKKIITLALSLILSVSSFSVAFATDIDDQSIKGYLTNKINTIYQMVEEDIYDDVESKEEFLNRVNSMRIEIEEYLSSSDEISNEFYDSSIFSELIDAYGDLDLKVNEINSDPSSQIGRSSSWAFGDILYYGIGSQNAIGEKSFTGHIAVMSSTPNFVIEAAKTGSNGAKVFHWNVSNLWSGASGIKQYKVTSLLGTNASSSEKIIAINYGLAQVGEPYALQTTIWSEDSWYCSKLVNAMWDHAGYNLESMNKFTLDGLIMVLPVDIIADTNVRLVKTWGTALPQ